MSILVLLHTEPDGSLAKPALEALGAARALAASTGAGLQPPASGAGLQPCFTVGLIGASAQPAAGLAAGAGAARVLAVTGDAFAQPRYSSDIAAAEALAKAASAEVVLVPGTSRAMRITGGLAARLGGAADTHVTKVSAEGGSIAVARWFYRQRMEGTLSRAERPWVIALEPGTNDAWSGAPADATVEAISVDAAGVRTQVTGVRAPASGEQTVRPDADLLFVAGAGWTKKQPDGQVHADDAQACILGFLRAASASLGGSKSLVDQSGEGQTVLSFMTHLNQVGQTGASPRHRKGLATCCHGEEPHVIGWRFITERRAVNLNPNCGWSQGKADVVYVADAFAVMKKVNELLGSGL
jgi:electron transfer flavoprotein alpha subunit